VGAALLWGLVLLARRVLARDPEGTPSRWLLALLMVSTLSHLALDFTNSYGVHVLWPVDNRWQYGDSVFIIEPWLWVAALPALVLASRYRLMKAILTIIPVAIVIAAWRGGFLLTGAFVALVAGAALMVLGTRRMGPRRRPWLAVGAWAFVTLVMAFAARTARLYATRTLSIDDSAVQLMDMVVSPAPANPLCASVLSVELSGDRYRLLMARVSTAPSVIRASRCTARNPVTSPFRASTRPSSAAVHWEAEWSAPAAELAQLARNSCPARAALQFMRAPLWQNVDSTRVLLSDARFGTSGNGFAEVTVPRHSGSCSDGGPPWVPPRVDIMDAVPGH
jgi:inner membrane protein